MREVIDGRFLYRLAYGSTNCGHSALINVRGIFRAAAAAVGALGRARAAAAGADHIPIPSDANSLAPPDWRFAFAIIR